MVDDQKQTPVTDAGVPTEDELEDEKKERERQEDRDLQRAVLSQIKPVEEAPLYVSDKPPKPRKKRKVKIKK